MSQRLFATAKVPLFLDTIIHGTEKRKGEDVKIVTLSLRVQPFDAKLASSLDEGVQAATGVKPLLFSLNNAEPKSLVRRLDVGLGCPRQQLLVFASSDTTKESIAFDQAKVGGTYARTQKDINGYAFCFRVSFGPVGRRELEFIQDWHLSTRFVTFDQAEPGLFDEDPHANDELEDEGSDADQKARQAAQPLEWDDDGTGSGKPADTSDAPASIVEQEVGTRHQLHSHQRKSKSRGKKAVGTKPQKKRRSATTVN